MHKKLPDWKSYPIKSFEPFSHIKLIALDLDGTLIESKNASIPRKITKLSKSLKTFKYNVMLTLATGRTLSGIFQLLSSIPIPSNVPIIMYNGSIIVMNKSFEVIFKKTFSFKSLEKILQITAYYRVITFAYFCDWFGETKLNEYVFGWSKIDCPEFEHNNMPVNWYPSNVIDKKMEPSIVVIDTSQELQDKIDRLINQLRKIDDISISLGGTKYIEVKSYGINKGTALEYISKELHISRREILALGDNDNDSEMLEWAGIGVAVKNASQKAKQSSNYICQFDAFQGAIEVMKLVREARKYFYKSNLKILQTLYKV